jgi:hypothetical protein
MRRRLHQNNRQKNTVRLRLLYVVAFTTLIITLVTGLLVVFNLNSFRKSRAMGMESEGGGTNLNRGEIISEFSWDKDPVTASIVGPDADRVSVEAHSMAGGRGATGGLAPGTGGKNINLEIDHKELFDQDGIDISIDYRRNEPSGDFYSRGRAFNFGMLEGFITISYRIESPLGKVESINEKTAYEIPLDRTFRTYRFIYTPLTGKAEIFVNGMIVWQHQHEKNSALSWKNADKILIGRNMNGGGEDKVVFDNLVVRNAGSVVPYTESLLNFMLETKDSGVRIHWNTAANKDVDYFTVEKSVNGVDFHTAGVVPAKPDSSDEEYVFTDRASTKSTILYYRLRQTFKNKKYVTHELSAIKFNSEKSFSIDHITPLPFSKSFDISFYLPKSGQVWVQLTDEAGKIINTESFEAPQGKNVHVYRDEKDMRAGNYILYLIFENKKVSRVIEKS